MKLHYAEPQIALGIAFAVLAALAAAIFLVGALASRRQVDLATVQRAGSWIRRRSLALLVSLGVPVLGASFFMLPYSRGQAPLVRAQVKSGQFFWSISPNVFDRGDRVRFEVTSLDVNHGFGVYSPSGKMIGSVQAMPGYTNKLTLELDETGSYEVNCLEFCGIRHHLMRATFKVVRR